MTVVGTMIERVRREVLAGHRPQLNVLAADTDTSATTSTWTFSYDLAAITYTAYVAVDDEIVYVLSSDRSTKTALVLRGALGTTPAVHTAGDIVEVNPRFARALIFETMREEILSWPPNVYRIATADVAFASGTRGYDLAGVPADFIDVLQVRRAPDLYTGETSDVSWPRIPFRVERNMPTTSFPSGAAIFFDHSYKAGVTARITVSRPFDVLTAWTEAIDLETDVGLTGSLLDALKFGTLWRLMSGREIARTDTSANTEPRADQAVPGLLTTQASAQLLKIRDRRLADEAARLMALYGNF